MQARLTYALAAIAMGLPAQAVAGGFAISETGSRWSGRGNAATALSDSAIAVFYNPANLTALSGFNVEGGLSLISPSFEYTAPGVETVSTESALFTPPNLALSYTWQDLVGEGDLAFGFGFSVPYGSSFNWPTNWVGREAVQEIRLTGYELSPVLGYRPIKQFAIGGGLRIMPIGLAQKRAVKFGDQAEGNVDLAAEGTAFGASAGATVWPVDGLAFSVAWRSGATLDGEGNANFTFPAPFDTSANDPTLEGTLPLPQVLRFGIAYDVIPGKLSLASDLQYQFWNAYEELAVTFIDAEGTRSTTVDPKKSEDSLVLHFGGEYKVSEAFALRAGYIFDQHTQPEETIGPAPPDSDRHVVTLGASYFVGAIGIHAHFADVIFAERATTTNELPGTWTGGHPGGSSALIGSIGISAQFGGAKDQP